MPHIDDSQIRKATLTFVKTAMREPLLARNEEQALARRWLNDADTAALHQLVQAYTRLVIAISSRFRNYGLPLGDLVQEGSIGLLMAADKFDPDRNVRFSTYASWWIRSAIQDYVLRNWSIVRTGTTAAQKSLFFNLRRLRAKLPSTPGGGLTEEGRHSIAETLGVSLIDVERMELRLTHPDQSLNMPLSPEMDGDRQDFLPDGGPGPEQQATTRLDSEIRNQYLTAALDELNDRERFIINHRRLREKGATLKQLGIKLGVSKERVRQLENRALGKLKHAILKQTRHPGDLMNDME
ncbi:RNA polymerase factor sigma-32 [Aestuariispira insulae]|uniref:RNA polymerase sigma factor n=1 Tax=Aestuariispira insulae TaxID=1461337 RepID=A0A3D9HPU5_9PROT|nr:RNA polymerase factor sigma-32 [Aestuariispira insulae]RED51479.1 RNA polymerase RpoH-like sigma 32 subunit [Aestuariispira insulae]